MNQNGGGIKGADYIIKQRMNEYKAALLWDKEFNDELDTELQKENIERR